LYSFTDSVQYLFLFYSSIRTAEKNLLLRYVAITRPKQTTPVSTFFYCCVTRISRKHFPNFSFTSGWLATDEYSCMYTLLDRLRGLVVTVAGYTSTGPGSIPSANKLSKKTGSTQHCEYNWGLERNSSGSDLEIQETGHRDLSR
jgi:hypothetical protein